MAKLVRVAAAVLLLLLLLAILSASLRTSTRHVTPAADSPSSCAIAARTAASISERESDGKCTERSWWGVRPESPALRRCSMIDGTRLAVDGVMVILVR